MSGHATSTFGALTLLLLAGAPALAQTRVAEERATEGVGLTVYSSPDTVQGQPTYNYTTQRYETHIPGFAIVKDWRKLHLDPGLNTIRWKDVPAAIDATTVHVKSVTDPSGTSVLEQSFEYDLVSADKVLEKYIGRSITLNLEGGRTIEGTLLSFDAAHIVLQTSDPTSPVQIIDRGPQNVKELKFSALPGGLIAQPTLAWLLQSARGGDELVKATYETGEMSWVADYSLVTGKDDKTVDLSAWVTITNHSGATYKDADLKLVAGDVHRAPRPGMPEPAAEAVGARSALAKAAGFTEKAFFEYHLYTLGRSTTVPDRSIKQIELFPPVSGIPARKVFVYYGNPGFHNQTFGAEPYADRNYGINSNKKVDLYLEFKNAKERGLGIPLPAGRVRVHKKDDADGSLEFVGEDRVDHTPKDESVRLKLGSAFDIVGERKQTDFKCDYDHRWITETFEVRVRNHKAEEVEVIVKENLYRWVKWEIVKASARFEKQDARTVHFPLSVPKDGEAVLTYTVKYTW